MVRLIFLDKKYFPIYLSAMCTLFIISLGISLIAPAPVTVELREKDFGQIVEINVKDVLEVVLKGNPTTGYTWDVASVDQEILKQVGETKFKPDRKTRGSGGNIILSFEAEKAGKTSLKLIYHRSFEKDRSPIKVFEIKVTVK
jgi:inhibitor of cysteine peptidase